MEDMVNLSLGTAGITALLGYLVVFIGLIMLMLVVMALGAVMKKKSAPAAVEAVAAAEPVSVQEAEGTAGELKLYDTDPKDAAMVMAIVADTLGKPLNQLRFISIKEVRDDEI